MEWSISEVARATATTSRTLRHYGDVGLLAPSRTGPNGYRYYDEAALLRLQRILLLRELGLGLPAIADVLAGQHDVVAALETHLALLRQERDRLERQITSVTRTIERRKEGGPLMAEEMFDGFDHTQYREEVEQRWGREAYARSDRWYRGLSDEEKRSFGQRHVDIAADYARARDRGLAPDAAEVQEVVRRHHAWLARPMAGAVSQEYFLGLGEMYVADPRFAANYGGEDGARYVRDAMRVYAERHR
ncbi:MerR family transcriptional regulator [Georgenia thermotolerans]|uniref:MerR family transcriptional regulator n=1 Tax=Georgenia thermotolerans TaxID=527326 RepID=A0A7J5USC6_9MICO|nr:TipAS antibiotic-recognition domain-containing protein [Georgenia thermotolerans]KAE8765170.1 MerR family transcriptional regulator [Georgenia thermotolerans]